jgi:hypothetical protein
MTVSINQPDRLLNCKYTCNLAVYVYFPWSRAPLDRLCGLVVRLPGRRPRGPGFDFRRYQIFYVAVGLELGPLSFVRINEELLERNVAAPV